MKRIAIYQRGYVSEEEHRTINSFISAIPGARITAVYWDRDGSNRSQFRELISTVRAGSVDAIIAQSLVRFTPNGEMCLGGVEGAAPAAGQNLVRPGTVLEHRADGVVDDEQPYGAIKG